MALQESFELSDGTGASTYGTTWRAQIFTTESAYTITDVALYCFKYTSPGDITVSIRKTSGGKPIDGDLCSVTVAEGVISDFPTRAWYTFTFDTSATLDDATQYAIVWRAPGGDAGNYFAPFGYGSSGYAGGGLVPGASSGTIWGVISTTNDMDFRTYGGTPLPGKPTNPSPTDTVTDITLDETPLSWDASDPEADTYNIYFRIQGEDWVEVSSAQAALEWAIIFGTLGYGTTYEWRVDATNVYGTTTGDTWTFDSLDFDQPRTSFVLISGGSGAGPFDDPAGVEGTDWRWTGINFMTAIRRLVVVAYNKVYYEEI